MTKIVQTACGIDWIASQIDVLSLHATVQPGRGAQMGTDGSRRSARSHAP